MYNPDFNRFTVKISHHVYITETGLLLYSVEAIMV